MIFSYISNHILIIIVVLNLIVLLLLLLKINLDLGKFAELYRKINEDIKNAVSPKFIELSPRVNDFIDLAVEIWRIEQRISKSSSSLSENQLKSLESSVQKLRRYLERYDIEIVDYKNTKYNAGFNLDVLSIEKDLTIPETVIKETVEPMIMCKGQVVRKAKVVLLSNH